MTNTRSSIGWPVLLALAGILTACTGSSEQGLSYRLVVAAGSIGPCGAAPAASPPGLVLVPVSELNAALAEGRTVDCSLLSVVPTTAPPYSDGATDPAANVPYELVNNAQGSVVFASFPRAGKVLALGPTLVPDGAAFAGDAALGLCPTRLVLSPNATQLAVIDDPANLDAGCDPTPADARPPRVLLYRLAEAARTPIVLQPPLNFQTDRQSGPIAVALSDRYLLVLAPFAGNYRLYRFDVNASGAALQAQAPVPVLETIPSLTPGTGITSLDLTPAGDRLLIGFDNNTGGSVLPVLDPGASASVGPPLQAAGAPVGPARRIVSDPLVGTVAVLGGNGTTLLLDTRAARVGAFGLDLEFTPDGFAWALGPSAITRIDQQTFPADLDPRTLFNLGFSSARSIGWVLDPTVAPAVLSTMRP